MAETFNRFSDFGQWLAHDKNAFCWPGSARTGWGSYSAPPDPLAGGRKEGRGIRNRERERERERFIYHVRTQQIHI